MVEDTTFASFFEKLNSNDKIEQPETVTVKVLFVDRGVNIQITEIPQLSILLIYILLHKLVSLTSSRSQTYTTKITSVSKQAILFKLINYMSVACRTIKNI